MTRLEQAKRWWRNNDGTPVPPRHAFVLEEAALIVINDVHQEYWTTDKGKKVLGR